MDLKPPDILLLGPEWPNRALLRAQLIEEGLEVVALDAWPVPSENLQPGRKPRVVIVDLHGLPEPHRTLAEMASLIEPDRVLVVTALGTMTGEEVRRLGFHVMSRPAALGEIAAAAVRLLADRPSAT